MGLTNTQRLVLGLVIFLLLVIGWGLFPLFFQWLMRGIGTSKTHLHDFGSLGDIYGSLTALFTSATLIIVLYSAYLQREANKDAREAMANQLQQARDATAKQLTQARKALREQLKQAETATQQQIDNAQALSDLQLNHAQKVATQQLELVQKTHNAQMMESKHAIFSNMFNILLNQKNEAHERLNIRLGDKKLQSLFRHLSDLFEEMIGNDWKEYRINNKVQREIISDKLFTAVTDYTQDISIYDELQSYFYNYCSLIRLIKKKEYQNFDTNLYIGILSNLMSQSEQETLLWYCTSTQYFIDQLKGSKLFDAYFSDGITYFIFRNFEKSLFDHSTILENWDKYLKEQNPT